MRDQHQLTRLTSAPAATETFAQLDKINRALILVCPTGILNMLELGVDEHQTARTKQRMHPAVIQPYIPIQMLRGLTEQRSFQVCPPLHHASQKFSPAGVEGR